MVNLGPGVDSHVNTAATPTWIFTPTSGLPNNVRLYNEGNKNTVYVGGSGVTPNTGIAIPVGSRPFEIQNAGQTLYACAAWNVGAGLATSTTSITAGTTTLNFAAGGMPNIPVGTTFVLASGAGQEVVTTATSSATTTITISNATLFDHVTPYTASAVTVGVGQLRVTAGVL